MSDANDGNFLRRVLRITSGSFAKSAITMQDHNSETPRELNERILSAKEPGYRNNLLSQDAVRPVTGCNA